MNKQKPLLMLTLTLLMAVSLLIAVPPATAQPKTPLAGDAFKRGPREENLQMNFYSDVETAYGALKAGEIDAVWYDITHAQYLDAKADPNLQLAPVDDMGIYEIDINNNYSVPYEIREAGEFVRNPCNDVSFRKAMALLFDKDYVVSTCCGGFAKRTDVMVAAPVGEGWKHPNRSDWLVNQYDPSQAQTLLDNAGFVVGSTPNPAYDPDVPWSQECLRTYPSDWDGMQGKDLTPLYAAIRSDDDRRKCAGEHLAANLELSGVPVNEVLKSMAGHYSRVMGQMDYHYYTGGWSLGRFPTSQRDFYHSDFWYPYGANYITGVNKTGDPNYPDLDPYLEDIYYCKDIASAKEASRKAQELYIKKYCINIPMYSARAFWVFSKDLLGMVNMDGYSLDNMYTFMNMKYVGDRGYPAVGLITPPYQFNVLFSSWFYDRQVMDRCYGAAAGITLNPYNLGRDQPGEFQDWTAGTWVDPEDGVNKSMVTIWFRENIKWVNPTNGTVNTADGTLTADDFRFSKRFIAAFPQAWTYDGTVDIHHMKVVSPYCLQIYFHSKSYWLQYQGDYVIHPPTWKNKFCMTNTTTVTGVTPTACEELNLTQYGAGQILEVVSATHGGTTLTEGVDYEVVMRNHESKYIHWLKNMTTGEFSITYYTPDPAKDPTGYYPGEVHGYTWKDYPGIGTHYLVDYVKGAGGYASLEANRHYWLETPVPDPAQTGDDRCTPLPAEVDWFWNWRARDTTRPLGGPRTGYYMVDISDVVKCTAAYGATGSSDPPSENWFVGADLAPPACTIDISDVVTITGRYGLKFGGWSDVYTCP